MPTPRLHVRLESLAAREFSLEACIQLTRTESAAHDVVELPTDDQRGVPIFGSVNLQQRLAQTNHFSNTKGLFSIFTEFSDIVLVSRRFEEVVNVAEDVCRGDVARIEGAEFG